MTTLLLARMTGAGMGGCAIALIHRDDVDEAILNIGKTYESEIGYSASFYVAQIGDGAREITAEFNQL